MADFSKPRAILDPDSASHVRFWVNRFGSPVDYPKASLVVGHAHCKVQEGPSLQNLGVIDCGAHKKKRAGHIDLYPGR